MNIKLHGNSNGRSRIFPRGWTDTIKLIVAVRNFAKAPTKYGNLITVLKGAEFFLVATKLRGDEESC